MKYLVWLLLLPFKGIVFILEANSQGQVGNENDCKTNIAYKPVGKNGEVIPVIEKK